MVTQCASKPVKKHHIVCLWMTSCILFFCKLSTFGQIDMIPVTTVGIATPILDNGVGVQFGGNVAYEFTSYLALEGQVSYLYSKIRDSFLSGRSGTEQAINILGGVRGYLNSSAKMNRVYVNILLGGQYLIEDRNTKSWRLGFSGGGFLRLKQLLFGLTFETPQHIILKSGYHFD